MRGMEKTTWKRGMPIAEPLQEKLRALIKERGESAAADFFGMSKVAMLRAAAGSGVRRVTAFTIETKLSELQTAAA